jgi:hypothetical protein
MIALYGISPLNITSRSELRRTLRDDGPFTGGRCLRDRIGEHALDGVDRVANPVGW